MKIESNNNKKRLKAGSLFKEKLRRRVITWA